METIFILLGFVLAVLLIPILLVFSAANQERRYIREQERNDSEKEKEREKEKEIKEN